MTQENNNGNNSNVQRQIDENLRRVYKEKLEEELPDRFQQLLAQLKAQDPGNEPDK